MVARGELDNVLTELIEKQKIVIEDVDKCLPLIGDENTIKYMTKKRKQAEAQLRVLEKGFVPIVGGWFWDIDTKSKWGSKAVKEILETMPEEVREIMDESRINSIFDKIKVSGSRRGDPMLVGTAGGANFLLAMWANLEGNFAIGFVTSRRNRNG